MSEQLLLYTTPPHACSYLPDRQAVTLFADPNVQFDAHLYQWLIDKGFRRSGEHLYRPRCGDCEACIPVRIDTRDWQPQRNQRRAWRHVQERLTITIRPAAFDPQHYALYARYIGERHADGDMADGDETSYQRFLFSHWATTRFHELYLDGELLAVAVTDYLPLGLSAVYTFFDPQRSQFSPGVLAILCQISECQRLGLHYLYLGYWIKECRKMAYKGQYRALEGLMDGQWRPVSN